MMTTGPGSLPNVAAYDEQNIQRLKNLGSNFRNLGYKGQLGTKQLERLGRTMSSLPQPPAQATVAQAPWTPPPVQPVSNRAEFVKLGTGLSRNLSPNPTWKADPVLFSPPAPMTPFLPRSKPVLKGGQRGGGGGGQSKLSLPSQTPYLSQQPYQSDLGKDTGGTSGVADGLTGLPSPNKMASYQPVVSNPLANFNNPKANQNSLAATAVTPATNHSTYAAKGPTLGQRQQSQLAASPSGATVQPTKRSENPADAASRAAWQGKGVGADMAEKIRSSATPAPYEKPKKKPKGKGK